MKGATSQKACQYVAVFIPIVALGSALESILGSHLHRIVLAGMVIILDTVSLVGAYVIIPMSSTMGMVLGGIIAGSVGFFGLLAYIGYRLQNQLESAKSEKILAGCQMTAEEIFQQKSVKSNDSGIEITDSHSCVSNSLS